MKNKYYTPDIEDLRVGYECEVYSFNIGGFDITLQRDWFKFIISNEKDLIDTIKLISLDLVRTPYLTKEQLKIEGWIIEEIEPLNPFIKGKKDSKELLFNRDNYELHLTNQISLNAIKLLYNGECKSINDFRYICKLLKI